MLFYIRFSLPMMITIAVADFNQTYFQGLKTMMVQGGGFAGVFRKNHEIDDGPVKGPSLTYRIQHE